MKYKPRASKEVHVPKDPASFLLSAKAPQIFPHPSSANHQGSPSNDKELVQERLVEEENSGHYISKRT